MPEPEPLPLARQETKDPQLDFDLEQRRKEMQEKFDNIKKNKAQKVLPPKQVEEEEFKEVNPFSDRDPIEYEGDKSPNECMLRSSSIVQGSVLEVVAENGGEESPPLSPVESRSQASTSQAEESMDQSENLLGESEAESSAVESRLE